MDTKLTIVTCYEEGTEDLIAVWYRSVVDHTANSGIPFKIVILVRNDQDEGLKTVLNRTLSPVPVKIVKVDTGISPAKGSRLHGRMLDQYIPSQVDTQYVMTMDTDCFPVADGWLNNLFAQMNGGARIVGVLHPWAPPPEDMDKNLLAWRMRSQQCWKHTHVACQMMSVADFKELDIKYNDGDDTGMLIPVRAGQRGWQIGGFMPNRSPISHSGLVKVDPEYNRYVSVVYGDAVYHAGGYTRVRKGDDPIMEKDFGWAREKMIADGGAEFLLQPEHSYQYKFDKEEDVAAEKMQRYFGMPEKRMGA